MVENEKSSGLARNSRDEAKQQFANRLSKLRQARGWRQAELARQADVLRDSISNYERGQVLPTPHNLEKLAKVFGKKPEDLLPNATPQHPVARAVIGSSIEFSLTNPRLAFVKINRWMSSATALKIATILDEELDVADGS